MLKPNTEAMQTSIRTVVPDQALAPALPSGVGVGLKSAHYQDVLAADRRPAFLEVHAENYLHAGGPAHRFLTAIRKDSRMSLHGVGLSLGGPNPPGRQQLAARRALIDRYQPDEFSEHLAWSGLGATYFNDLLPIGYTEQDLARVDAHITATQDALGRRILVENPASYVRYSNSTYSEPQFLTELSRRSGCGLLLDVNNIVVTARNHGLDPHQYLKDLPLHAVGEIHLAAHRGCATADGELLIDSHDGPVQPSTWQLFDAALRLTGPRPTLIEWDSNLPAWSELLAEADEAAMHLATVEVALAAR